MARGEVDVFHVAAAEPEGCGCCVPVLSVILNGLTMPRRLPAASPLEFLFAIACLTGVDGLVPFLFIVFFWLSCAGVPLSAAVQVLGSNAAEAEKLFAGEPETALIASILWAFEVRAL